MIWDETMNCGLVQLAIAYVSIRCAHSCYLKMNDSHNDGVGTTHTNPLSPFCDRSGVICLSIWAYHMGMDPYLGAVVDGVYISSALPKVQKDASHTTDTGGRLGPSMMGGRRRGAL